MFFFNLLVFVQLALDGYFFSFESYVPNLNLTNVISIEINKDLINHAPSKFPKAVK